VVERLDIPCDQVDAHNIVPVWAASPKQEYGAYTLRPKIHRALPMYLDEFPRLRRHPFPWPASPTLDHKALLDTLKLKDAGPPIDWIVPGEKAAQKQLRRFVEDGLADYPEARNDPNQHGQSDLSPYLHSGQLAPQRVALEVRASDAPDEAREAFLEELIVRRELSDNLCFYNAAYDSPAGFPPWAVKTLTEHKRDPRPYVYSLEQLEVGETHDDLWNAAQLEMVNRGKMHGYLRMYWAKKILEWTPSPERAIEIAILLNDRYELDGRDPNGYAGVAWSIGGVHDRPWFERPVFGKIRYVSYGGCKRKFDVAAYVRAQARPG
jgi:deoxyribodipyrimidine photo-lyase